MILSDVAICNIALSHLGVRAISSLDEPTPAAVALNRIYDFTRDSVLRVKNWNFAKVKTALNRIADQQVPGWAYVYSYPVKCVCIRKVYYDIENKNPQPQEYEVLYIPSISQKVIACDFEDAYAEYTYQITDPTQFDISFVMAFAFLLAAQVAKQLTGSDEKAKLALQLYNAFVSDAARINDYEKYIKQTQISSFEEVR